MPRSRCSARLTSTLFAPLVLLFAASLAAEEIDFHYSVFDGKSTQGWYATGCEIAAKDGVLTIKPGDGWVRAQTHLEDFVLEFDWRTGPKMKGNLFFRSATPPAGKSIPDDGSATPLSGQKASDSVKPGEWTHIKLTVVGKMADLERNGKTAWKTNKVTMPEGFIGFQAPADGEPIELRKIEVTEFGFRPLFQGKDMDNWKPSPKTGHSRASKNQSAGKWIVEDGAIVGTQDIPGNGGIIITNQQYEDFEVSLQMNNDFGPDSGLFLRSSEKGVCYQCRIDYHTDGSLAGVYGEGMGGDPNERCFKFLKTAEEIEELKAPFKLPVSPKEWPKFWRHGEWNEIRARITGNPPKMETWVNGVQFLDFQDDKKRLASEGHIGLQIHGGNRGENGAVRYRNIRVKEIH